MKSGRNLRFFQGIRIPDGMEDTFRALEDILQIQHGSDGRHPIATASEDGFMSAEDKKKLDKVIKDLQSLADPTSSSGSSSGGGGGSLSSLTVMDVSASPNISGVDTIILEGVILTSPLLGQAKISVIAPDINRLIWMGW